MGCKGWAQADGVWGAGECGVMGGDNGIRDKILLWFATGRVGLSSKSMACAVAGLPQDSSFGVCHPSDPDDLNRCLMLLEAVPEIRDNMDKVAALSGTWAKLVERWSEVEQCFLDEVGLNWTKGDRASRTYELMKSIGC